MKRHQDQDNIRCLILSLVEFDDFIVLAAQRGIEYAFTVESDEVYVYYSASQLDEVADIYFAVAAYNSFVSGRLPNASETEKAISYAGNALALE